MKQTVRILPSSFHIPLEQAIKDELNRKFANKVVLNVGLCIALWDITEQSQSFILPGDGASHTNVKFRFVVFRPFMDEILVGKIRSCSREAVHVTLGFFDEIIIPPEYLQQPARFDETEQVWVWEYETEDGKHDLFMDEGSY
nr:EOG090X0DHL [Triops cancriformis]